jgi:hypothetical protein
MVASEDRKNDLSEAGDFIQKRLWRPAAGHSRICPHEGASYYFGGQGSKLAVRRLA